MNLFNNENLFVNNLVLLNIGNKNQIIIDKNIIIKPFNLLLMERKNMVYIYLLHIQKTECG